MKPPILPRSIRMATVVDDRPSSAATHLSVELQHEIVWLAMGWQCRLLSHEHRDMADSLATSITFSTYCPAEKLIRRINQLPRLKHISVRAVEDVDCEKLDTILNVYANREHAPIVNVALS